MTETNKFFLYALVLQVINLCVTGILSGVASKVGVPAMGTMLNILSLSQFVALILTILAWVKRYYLD